MPTTLKQSGITPESFEAFLATRNEPAWLTDSRRAAWQVFQDLPLPTRADEEWMRTDIRLFRLDKFSLPAATATETELPEHALMVGVQFAGVTAALNSRPVLTQFRDTALAKQGVLFGSLD
ncbi:MAG TPA: Fe-S cluster assembly protein SufD, partial [Pirellulales bacterium]